MNLLYTLYELIKNRSRKAYKFFKENCLGERHYERFKRARVLSKYTGVRFIDEYIVIRTRYYNPERREYYHGVYLVGIDDTTNKLFCHRLPWRHKFEDKKFLEKITIKDIYEMLGITDGFERIQGDLMMRKYKIESKKSLVQWMVCAFKNHLWRNFIEYRDILMEKIDEMMNELNCDEESCKKIKKCKKLFEFGSIFKTLNIMKPCDCGFYEIIIKAEDVVENDLYKIFKDEELLYQTLADMEKIYRIHAGNHLITLVGVMVFHDTYIVIREQNISFEHHEHGYVEIPINDEDIPCIVSFRTLIAHQIHDL